MPRAAPAFGVVLIAALAITGGVERTAAAQQPPGQGRGGRGGGAQAAFPKRPPADPAVLDRGKALYALNCQFCHGADTRGGDAGPSLLRSQLVQDDRTGELVAGVLSTGRPPAMPKFDFTPAQASDIAAFLHSFDINSRDPARQRPENIVTGDPAAGQAYFAKTCASCHSLAGDLKDLRTRFPDSRALQQWWLMPGGDGRGRGAPTPAAANLKPITATVTLPDGQKFEGRLVRIDEFSVSIVDADAVTRTFRRDREVPLIDVRDPLQQHRALLRVYSDKDIHDVTAYLVSAR
jgi:mono/diheme cytochrome c family protein